MPCTWVYCIIELVVKCVGFGDRWLRFNDQFYCVTMEKLVNVSVP